MASRGVPAEEAMRGIEWERALPPAEKTIQSAEETSRAVFGDFRTSRRSADSAPLTARFATSVAPRLRRASATSAAYPFPPSSPVPREIESPSTRRNRRPVFLIGALFTAGAGGASPIGSPSDPLNAKTNPAANVAAASVPTTAGRRHSSQREVARLTFQIISACRR